MFFVEDLFVGLFDLAATLRSLSLYVCTQEIEFTEEVHMAEGAL